MTADRGDARLLPQERKPAAVTAATAAPADGGRGQRPEPGVRPAGRLTSRPTDAPASLPELVGHYSRRVVVEEYHKGQKTGVGIERLALEAPAGLRAAIAVLNVVAVVVANLRVLSRDPRASRRWAAARRRGWRC
ncbi:hypothetical protein J0H58_30370 [bacterium]|nr:hypothetical protein [bacterium]